MIQEDINSFNITSQIPESSAVIALIAKATRTKNLDTAIFLVNHLFTRKDNTFEHPTLNTVTTYPIDSFTQGMWNIVSFCDECGKNEWILIQSTSFTDIIITEQEIFCVAKPPNEHVKKQISRALVTRKDRGMKASVTKKIGFKIGQTTPFHFFYDQFKFLPLLQKGGSVFRGTFPVFFDPEATWGIKLEATPPSDMVLFYPNVITQNSCVATGFGGSDRRQKVKNLNLVSHNDVVAKRVSATMTTMELAMRDSVDIAPNKPNSGLCLWIGVTSTKRSWLEQVEGYAAIINDLSEKVEKLTILVDGMTASIDGESVPKSDDETLRQILARTNNPVEVISLIGMTYEQKIALGKYANAFISNGGTGSFVPLRIIQLPGVIHSNSRLLTFPDYYDKVDILYGEDKESSNIHDKAGTTSYSLNWEEVVDKLLPKISQFLI